MATKILFIEIIYIKIDFTFLNITELLKINCKIH